MNLIGQVEMDIPQHCKSIPDYRFRTSHTNPHTIIGHGTSLTNDHSKHFIQVTEPVISQHSEIVGMPH